MMASAVNGAFVAASFVCSGSEFWANESEVANRNPRTRSIRMGTRLLSITTDSSRKRMQKKGREPISAVFAVQQIAHGLPPRLVRFLLTLAFVGIHAALGRGLSGLRLAAR